MHLSAVLASITLLHRDQVRAPVGVPVRDGEVERGISFMQARACMQDELLEPRRAGQDVHFSALSAGLGFLDREQVWLAVGAPFSHSEGERVVGFMQRGPGLQNEVLELGGSGEDVDFSAFSAGAVFLDCDEIQCAVTIPVCEGEIKLCSRCLVQAASCLGGECLESRGSREDVDFSAFAASATLLDCDQVWLAIFVHVAHQELESVIGLVQRGARLQDELEVGPGERGPGTSERRVHPGDLALGEHDPCLELFFCPISGHIF